MTDFERTVRAAMTSHQLETPEVDGLMAGLRRQDQPTRARWPFALAAAACVVLVAVGAIVGASLLHHASRARRSVAQSSAQSSAHTGVPPVVPSGWKPVSFHGLQVYVPADFGYGQAHCGQATSDTVEVDFVGASELCAVRFSASLVAFATLQSPNRHYLPQPTIQRAITLDGHAALSAVVTKGTRTQGSVQVPDLGVAMGVDSTDAATVAAIVNSASIVAVDANGCPSGRPVSLDANPTRSVVDLVPGTPTSVRLCRYDDSGLVASARLTAADAAALATAMNEHPSVTRSQTLCTADTGDAVQATFTSTDGAQVNVQVIIMGTSCAANLSNGLLSRAAIPTVAKTIITLVGASER
jgi:hypothetical protein